MRNGRCDRRQRLQVYRREAQSDSRGAYRRADDSLGSLSVRRGLVFLSDSAVTLINDGCIGSRPEIAPRPERTTTAAPARQVASTWRARWRLGDDPADPVAGGA